MASFHGVDAHASWICVVPVLELKKPFNRTLPLLLPLLLPVILVKFEDGSSNKTATLMMCAATAEGGVITRHAIGTVGLQHCTVCLKEAVKQHCR